MEVKEINIKEKEEMTTEDEFIIIRYTYPRLNKIKKTNPEFYEEIKNKIGIELRITKIEINKKTTEYLISNLDKNEFHKEDLKEVYGKRWQVEISYNSIKNKLKIEEFTGNLPQFIYQDIYAQIVVYNQIQDMLYPGRKEIKSPKGKDYKINEGKAIGIFKEKYINNVNKRQKKSNKRIRFIRKRNRKICINSTKK